MAASLLDLPSELIAEILSQFDAPKDLLSSIRASPLMLRVFHSAAVTVVRRLGENALGGEFGMRTALAVLRLSQLRCTQHTAGCPDRSPCAREIFASYARQTIPPLLREETRLFLYVLDRVDRVVDRYLERVVTGWVWKTKPCCKTCVERSLATFDNSPRRRCPWCSASATKEISAGARRHFFLFDLFFRARFARGTPGRAAVRLIKNHTNDAADGPFGFATNSSPSNLFLLLIFYTYTYYADTREGARRVATAATPNQQFHRRDNIWNTDDYNIRLYEQAVCKTDLPATD